MSKLLLKGFQRFKEKAYEGDDPLMPRLVREGQDPRYFIISCIDSRANPGTIFDTAAGTFFAHKAMGAIVRPYKTGTALAAALDFAINYNAVDTLIVLGHTKCGAIDALIQNLNDEEISSFLEVAQGGLAKAQQKTKPGRDLHRVTEEQIVLDSVENLTGYPSVRDALAKGKIEIKPWLFDMEQGHICEHNPKTDIFEPIESEV
ncbi:MAG: hypothetical protein CMH28_05125 [Micavibrio sp.]|nr:hypothetical protein [Micavibrio sp.]|tara:strand:- start:66 stop:677 length:612 start_codon:yes stop_codon:yes gene_type:complete